MNTDKTANTRNSDSWTGSQSDGEIFRSAAPVSRDSSQDSPDKPTTPGKTPEIPNDPYGCDNPDGLDIRASSTMDCTGLIPALPESDAELESYAELYHYPADIFKG